MRFSYRKIWRQNYTRFSSHLMLFVLFALRFYPIECGDWDSGRQETKRTRQSFFFFIWMNFDFDLKWIWLIRCCCCSRCSMLLDGPVHCSITHCISAAFIFFPFHRLVVWRCLWFLCMCTAWMRLCNYFLHVLFCWAFTCWQTVGCRFAYARAYIAFFCCCLFFLSMVRSSLRSFILLFSWYASGIFSLVSHRQSLWSSSTQCIGFYAVRARMSMCMCDTQRTQAYYIRTTTYDFRSSLQVNSVSKLCTRDALSRTVQS